MDLIFANQSLYYLPNLALKQTINEFYELSNHGAIFFATMMSEKNGYFAKSEPPNEQGLSKVSLTGRLNETSFIRFIKNADALKTLFEPFETLVLGEYDPIYFYDDEGSANHFIFVGVKR